MNSAQQSPLASTLQPAFPRLTRGLLALFVFAGLVGRVVGQTYYGPDNASSGFGTASSFTWDTTTSIWNIASNGNGGKTTWVNWTSGDTTANNANLVNTTSALTLTLGAAISVGNITAVTGTGGSWTIANSSNNLTVNTGSTTNASLTLSGGTFTMAGTGSYSFINLNVTASSTLDFGTAGVTSLALTNLRIATGATLTIQNWVRFSDQLTVANAPITGGTVSGVTITGGTAVVAGADISKSNINFANYGELAKWNSGSFSTNQLAAVPEPSTYGAIMAAGCAGLIGWRRRRSRREAATKA